MSGEARPGLRDTSPPCADTERVRKVYETYASDPYYRRIWRPDSRASRFMADRKWELIETVLRRERVDVRSARILDLGVGTGMDSARFSSLTFRPECFIGLDMLERYARTARASHPWMSTLAGDAGSLPFQDRRFDLVYQSTMLSSVPDPAHRARIFREVDRVLASGGAFLSYDTRYPNPWNPHTRPIRAAELRGAFRGWVVKVWSTTVIPQMLRALAPLSLTVCRFLERVPVLRSHLLILARKAPGVVPSSGRSF
jgi:ubiquinone/menaquinone biosynthesis C-methylase UbiE